MSSSAAPSPARWVPYILVAGVVSISFAAILFRLAAPTHPMASAAIRLLVAATLLAPFVWRARAAGRLPGRLIGAAAAGGFFYALHFGSWVWSLELTTVAASVTLVTATPLLLAVWALATGRDRPTGRLWIALALAAIGVSIIGGVDSLTVEGDALLGDGLALLGAAAMAGYMLVVRRQGPLDVWAFTGVATACGGLLLLFTGLLAGIDLAPASSAAFGFLVLSALVPQLIGHSALTWALRHVPPTTVGIATLGEPVGSTLLAWFLLSERADPGTLAGCAVTLTAVALALSARRASAS